MNSCLADSGFATSVSPFKVYCDGEDRATRRSNELLVYNAQIECATVALLECAAPSWGLRPLLSFQVARYGGAIC